MGGSTWEGPRDADAQYSQIRSRAGANWDRNSRAAYFALVSCSKDDLASAELSSARSSGLPSRAVDATLSVLRITRVTLSKHSLVVP